MHSFISYIQLASVAGHCIKYFQCEREMLSEPLS